MEIKRATEVFVRTKRRLTIRQPESVSQTFCPQCAAPMIAAEQIAAVFGVGYRAVYRLVEANAAHFVETNTGAVLLCPTSLEAAIRSGAIQMSETLARILKTGEENEK